MATGDQPRPLRYRGRLNRRGRKARFIRMRVMVGFVDGRTPAREMLVKVPRAALVADLFEHGQVAGIAVYPPRAGAR
jgi:hypothetical protein